MSRRFDRFLRHAPLRPHPASLGRVFGVTQETWRLSDDPTATRPTTELLVSGRTASDAADLARLAAGAFHEHGFHKPSGAWWGADDTHFHRFVVHAGRQRRRRAKATLIGSGAAGVAALALVGFLYSRGRRRDAKA
jgi:hypothetical protein